MERAPRRFESFHGLTLLLSGRCNLACAYCYQSARRGRRRMPWVVARAALDFLLTHGSPPMTVEFSGGEPLLEQDLLMSCVLYAEERRSSSDDLRFVLTTNGLLLTGELLEFLVAHGVHLHLSFDGAPEAQDLRAPGTFARLDKLLSLIRATLPEYFEDHVWVGVVLHAGAVPLMAEGARYFLKKGIASVVFSPAVGGDGSQDAQTLTALRQQTLRIAEAGLAHWERTGRVPVAFLRDEARPAPEGNFLCGAGYGKGLCVDTGGGAWTCPLFAPSLQKVPPLAREISRATDLGDIRAPALPSRLASLTDRTRRLPLLTGHEEKVSGHRACGDCEYLPACSPCPAAISHAPGASDPKRVPEFHCAFTRATLEARRWFQREMGAASEGRVGFVPV